MMEFNIMFLFVVFLGCLCKFKDRLRNIEWFKMCLNFLIKIIILREMFILDGIKWFINILLINEIVGGFCYEIF